MAFIAPVLPFIAAAAAVGGQVVSGIGKLGDGLYQSQVAENNAKIAGQNADYALAAGYENTDIEARKGAAEGAALKTEQAASGVDVNSGSAVDVQRSQRATSQLDAETMLNNAILEAYGYKSEKAQYEADAKQTKRAAWIGFTGDMLSTASSVIGGDFFSPGGGSKQAIGATAGGGSKAPTVRAGKK